MISGVLLDLAGVIYEGEKAIPGALDAVDRLRHAGFSLRFVTNTTRITKHMVLQRLARLGFGVTESELFTPAQGAREWLARNDCSSSLLVHPDLAQEFEDDFWIAFIAQSWLAMPERPSTMQISIARFVN